jgi:hypothetical protein
MCHGLDASLHDGTVVAGDNRGRLHLLDPRQAKPFAAAAVHKKDKVHHCGPNQLDVQGEWQPHLIARGRCGDNLNGHTGLPRDSLSARPNFTSTMTSKRGHVCRD